MDTQNGHVRKYPNLVPTVRSRSGSNGKWSDTTSLVMRYVARIRAATASIPSELTNSPSLEV